MGDQIGPSGEGLDRGPGQPLVVGEESRELGLVARGTPGFSGAELANLVVEAKGVIEQMKEQAANVL